MKSAVLIIPTNLQADGNAVAEAMGWGTNNYSVPLTTNGVDITHYGLHTHTSAQFESWVTGIEPLPTGMEYAQSVIDALIYSFRNDIKNREHFNLVLEANGLQDMPSEIES